MICEEAGGARKLTLDEIMGEYEGHVIWIQVRERLAAWPVKFSHVAQMDDGRNMMVFDLVKSRGCNMMRPTLLGKTWVAWSAQPLAAERREAFYHG